jgi:hypothetical protein
MPMNTHPGLLGVLRHYANFGHLQSTALSGRVSGEVCADRLTVGMNTHDLKDLKSNQINLLHYQLQEQ